MEFDLDGAERVNAEAKMHLISYVAASGVSVPPDVFEALLAQAETALQLPLIYDDSIQSYCERIVGLYCDSVLEGARLKSERYIAKIVTNWFIESNDRIIALNAVAEIRLGILSKRSSRYPIATC